LFFLKWENQGGVVSRVPPRRIGDRRSLVFALSLLFFLLSTLSKPSVVMLPFVLALCVWWMRGKIRWRDMLAFAPFALISIVASAWTIWEQRFHAHAVGPDWVQTFPERLIIAGQAIWFYLGKLVWPHPLIFIYPRWHVDPSNVVLYLPLMAAIAAVIAFWFLRTLLGRAFFFAATYYVVSLFPVLGFFSVYFFRYSFVSDHFQYLASMGPLALAGAGIVTGCSRLVTSKRLSALPSTWRQPTPQGSGVAGSAVATTPLVGTCAAVLLLLVILTWRQTAVYHNLVTLYTATLTRNPGCWMAHYNLGITLNEQGDTDGAISHYREAVELWPGYAEAHYNLGRLLVQKGQIDEAITHYEKAVEINPSDADAHNNLGATLLATGRTDDAIAHYRKALVIQPDYADASCNLAGALLSKDDLDG